MQREFNSGTNQLPQSTIRANPYNKQGILKTGETQADLYGAFEIDSYDQTTGVYTVKRPTSDSLPDAQLLFSPSNVAATEAASFGMNGAFWVAFDTTNGTPSVGDSVGSQSGSYKLLKDNTGYKVLAYNATEERVLVRPFSSGGEAITQFETAAVATINTTINGTGGLQSTYSPYVALQDTSGNPFTFSILSLRSILMNEASTLELTPTGSDITSSLNISAYIRFADATNTDRLGMLLYSLNLGADWQTGQTLRLNIGEHLDQTNETDFEITQLRTQIITQSIPSGRSVSATWGVGANCSFGLVDGVVG